MGFFSELKEDLSQAVNELMPEEEMSGKEINTTEEAKITEESAETAEKDLETAEEPISEAAQEEEVQDSGETAEAETALNETEQLEAMLERIDSIELPEDMDFTKTEIEERQEEMEETEDIKEVEEMDIEDIEMEMEMEDTMLQKETIMEERREKMGAQMANKSVSDETAVITAGMIITGDVLSEGSMDVIGEINGNIEILGKLNITGTVHGNSKAAEIYADQAKITGELISDGTIKIGQSSVVIGNLTATSAVIAGAVKGDIDVQGPVVLDTSAIVMGNIRSKSVQINNGAVIEGMCSQCYAEVNPTDFFEKINKNK